MILLAQSARIGSPVLGVVIPALIFAASFLLTWMLYRHFSKRTPR
jgi:hypothetical protein